MKNCEDKKIIKKVDSFHVIEVGKGKEILFLHGYISDARIWERVLNKFKPNFRVLIPSLDGFYQFDRKYKISKKKFNFQNHVKNIVEIIKQRCKSAPVIVGWSYGASLALYLAVQYSDLIDSIYIFEPGINTFIENEKVKKQISLDRHSMMEGIISSLERKEYYETIEKIVDSSCKRQGEFQKLDINIQKIFYDNVHTLPFMMANLNDEVIISKKMLENINVTATISYSEESRLAYKLVAKELNKILPFCNSEILISTNHLAPIKNSKTFYESVMKHLAMRGNDNNGK